MKFISLITLLVYMGFETSSDIRDELIKRLKSDVLGPIGLDSENKPDENESLKLEDGTPKTSTSPVI